MRTTITLDDDVELSVRKEIQKSGKSAKEVYNTLLRAALAGGKKMKTFNSDFTLITFCPKSPGLMPGYSWQMSTAQILDRLDESEYLK